MRLPSTRVLHRFDVTNPEHVETTNIATIWKVARSDGAPAALKIYANGDMKNEAAGFSHLASLNGRGAAHIYKVADGIALMEWLDGPSLGDMARAGQDLAAANLVAQTAKTLHFPPPMPAADLPHLETIFSALLDAKIPYNWANHVKTDLKRAQSLARHLLETSPSPEALHGDLHHDNIRLGDRGYCAFDAKGIIGERSYELANAVRNPRGLEAEIRDPSRMEAVCKIYAEALDVPLKRFQEMAAAKAALSICWRLNDKKADPELDPEADLLEILLAQA